ncbi:hypothetical protein WR25_00076 isoform A [Diploscapter pachys]|uniref:Neurotransmitter-gated ion-channel ligand-binding domain-containing protein n=2 Tax=Diploscapter pachys TaxID=2018661 RepID=A0A2A2KEA5_9BILA|nr:hypothetical protein WR25_00076 isoform A [Diploscapter pachys]
MNAYKTTGQMRSLIDKAPPADLLAIEILEVNLIHIELVSGSSNQFNIYGDLQLRWTDARLTWSLDEWNQTEVDLEISAGRMIWLPFITDPGLCITGKCQLSPEFVRFSNDGTVIAVLNFQSPAECLINFKPYPEEENDCYIYFTMLEPNKKLEFDIKESEMKVLSRSVASSPIVSIDKDEHAILALEKDHSAWMVTHHELTVLKSFLRDNIPILQLFIHAQKAMSTQKFALRLPITIATMIMLASPLIGDLKMQIFVKLFVLSLQTLCFLYLCSIAPPNGFMGIRPSIYVFYETIFLIAFVSIMTTLVALALSRVKRTVPPSHRIYLVAKLINRVICCTEPDRSAAYQRYLDEFDGSTEQRPSAEIDYTQDWRHIYLAINNCVSGFMLSIFILVIFY